MHFDAPLRRNHGPQMIPHYVPNTFQQEVTPLHLYTSLLKLNIFRKCIRTINPMRVFLYLEGIFKEAVHSKIKNAYLSLLPVVLFIHPDFFLVRCQVIKILAHPLI